MSDALAVFGQQKTVFYQFIDGAFDDVDIGLMVASIDKRSLLLRFCLRAKQTQEPRRTVTLDIDVFKISIV